MCHYFSTIKCGHRLQSKQYFAMKQAAYHRLITVFETSLKSFTEKHKYLKQHTLCWLQIPVSKKRKGMSHRELRQQADIGKIRLWNINKVSHLKPLLLDVEMYKLYYWTENMRKLVGKLNL